MGPGSLPGGRGTGMDPWTLGGARIASANAREETTGRPVNLTKHSPRRDDPLRVFFSRADPPSGKIFPGGDAMRDHAGAAGGGPPPDFPLEPSVPGGFTHRPFPDGLGRHSPRSLPAVLQRDDRRPADRRQRGVPPGPEGSLFRTPGPPGLRPLLVSPHERRGGDEGGRPETYPAQPEPGPRGGEGAGPTPARQVPPPPGRTRPGRRGDRGGEDLPVRPGRRRPAPADGGGLPLATPRPRRRGGGSRGRDRGGRRRTDLGRRSGRGRNGDGCARRLAAGDPSGAAGGDRGDAWILPFRERTAGKR